MPSKKSNTIRFAVGSPENAQSWIWRIWVNNDDVYLGARQALMVFKVSLHKSNVWRIALVSSLKRENNESDRVAVKWKRPEEFTPGWTPSVGVLVSSIKPERPFKEVKVKNSGIRWFSPPAEGKKLVFKVLLSKPGFSENDLRHVMFPNDKFAGRLTKSNGEIVWLMIREEDLTAIEIQKIKEVMRGIKISVKPPSTEDTIKYTRAISVVSIDKPTAANQPTILDIPLGKENLILDQ